MGLSGTRAKVYRALTEWRVQPQDSSRLIKLTQKQCNWSNNQELERVSKTRSGSKLNTFF